MSEEITNAVIVERLDNLQKQNEKDHEAMLTQVLKTNGNVKNLQLWRAYIIGGLSIITLLIVPLIFMVLGIYLNK